MLSPSVFAERPRYSRPWQTLFSGSCITEESLPVFTTWTISLFRSGELQRVRRELGYSALHVQLPHGSSSRNNLEDPSSCLEFLGLQLNSYAGTICLPQAKLHRACRMVSDWLGRRSCTKRELLLLVGTLQHATSVVKAGRCLLRSLIDLSCRVKRLHYWVRLNANSRADLLWWDTFLVRWNGTCFLRTLVSQPPTLQMSSDGTGLWGCAAGCLARALAAIGMVYSVA